MTVLDDASPSAFAQMDADCPLRFMHGGDYRICYDPNGDFNSSSAGWLADMGIIVQVNGVQGTCTHVDCLTERAWHCVVTPSRSRRAAGRPSGAAS